jgi:hypothetical protein
LKLSAAPSLIGLIFLGYSVLMIGLRTGGFQDRLADRLVGFLGQGHDPTRLLGLPMVRDVQVDAHNDESMT